MAIQFVENICVRRDRSRLVSLAYKYWVGLEQIPNVQYKTNASEV